MAGIARAHGWPPRGRTSIPQFETEPQGLGMYHSSRCSGSVNASVMTSSLPKPDYHIWPLARHDDRFGWLERTRHAEHVAHRDVDTSPVGFVVRLHVRLT